jgi:peptide-methionine (S)-S-oxide reductase
MRVGLAAAIMALCVLLISAAAFLSGGFFVTERQINPVPSTPEPAAAELPAGFERATFGSGCFWCTEALFQQLKGVHAVASGYSGGQVQDPTYEEVCRGTTGHAEVIQVTYDPKAVSFAELLEVFWKTHDPTTLNRQGNDVGPQYRSAIFYHSDQQRELAEHYKQKLARPSSRRSPPSPGSIQPRATTRTITRPTPASPTAPWSSAPRSRSSGRCSRTS